LAEKRGTDLKEKSDIAIVGGGPCGSYSAYTAAKLGSKVLVCEEHKEIGVPKHCAGHINISSLKKLGIQVPQTAIENEIKGAIFYSPSNIQFVLRCHTPVTYVINRELFDKHLFDLAIKYGVQYRFNSKAKSLLFDSGHVNGVTLKGERGNSKKVEAKIVIDAEGCSSKLLKQTGLQRPKGSMMVRGIQAEVENVEATYKDMVEVYLGNKVAPGFFAWIIPRKDGSAKVGLATESGDPRKYLHRFAEKHPVASEKLNKSKINKISLHPIPLAGPIPKTYSESFLVVGDAASQVKPTTGGGVIFGLTCARIAGQVAYEAVKRQDFSEAFLSSYQSRWKRLVGFDLTAMLRIRKMLNSMSDNRIDGMIDLCRKLGVDSVLEKVGDLDFQGRSLIPMIKHPGTLAVISYFLFSWLKSTAKNYVSRNS
jgi:digeranylgeranylglycerophospholipid reductase